MSEIAALAMNPTPTEKLNQTGNGIETMEVLRENAKVRIKDDTDGKLEVVFDDTNGSASNVEKGGKFV